MNEASDGDTVVVPAGTCSWNSTLRITKGITLAGTGIDRTIIRDDVSRVLPSSGRVLDFSTAQGQDWRLTGFTFADGATLPPVNWNGVVGIGGGSKAFRIDHVKFQDPNAPAIRSSGDLWGVIDSSEFYTRRNHDAVIVRHTGWEGVGSYGDNSLATPTELGTAKAIYIENNTFTVMTCALLAVIDSRSGGRYVVRHNTFNNASAGNHGSDSSGRHRSARSFEVYNNVFTYPGTSGFAAVYLRGGTGVIFNNQCSGFTNSVLAANYRTCGPAKCWRMGRLDAADATGA